MPNSALLVVIMMKLIIILVVVKLAMHMRGRPISFDPHQWNSQSPFLLKMMINGRLLSSRLSSLLS